MWQIENFLPVSVDESKAILHIVIVLASNRNRFGINRKKMNNLPNECG